MTDHKPIDTNIAQLDEPAQGSVGAPLMSVQAVTRVGEWPAGKPRGSQGAEGDKNRE